MKQKKLKNVPYAEIEWGDFFLILFSVMNELLDRSLRLINLVVGQIL